MESIKTEVFCKLLLNGASYTKIGCIQFLSVGAKKYEFLILLEHKSGKFL